jgi:hypothetical protein
MGKDAGPTRGFVASLGVGPRATISTLKIGYPRIQALSQDEGQDGRSCAPMYPVAPAPAPWLRAAPKPPHVHGGGLYGLRVIKVNKYPLATRPS